MPQQGARCECLKPSALSAGRPADRHIASQAPHCERRRSPGAGKRRPAARGATREPPPRPTGQVRNCPCAGLRPRPQEKKGRGLQFQQPLVRGPPAGTPEGTIGGWYGWPAPRRGWLDHADEILSLSPVGLRRRTGSRPACFSEAKCPSGTGAGPLTTGCRREHNYSNCRQRWRT